MARAQLTAIRPFQGQPHAINVPPTVNALCDLFEAWAHESYRREDGTSTGTALNVKSHLGSLRQAAGEMDPRDLSSIVFMHVQQELLKSGQLARRTINDRLMWIGTMLHWAAKRRLLPASVVAEHQAISSLRPGQGHEGKPRKPVTWERVRDTLPFLSRVHHAMVLVQWSTGMRSGELVMMRPTDIEFGQDNGVMPWIYRPRRHKTQHHGKGREIPIGPAAQKVLRPFLCNRDREAYIFSPKESRFEYQLERTLTRVTPPHHGNYVGSNRKLDPKREPGEHFTSSTYEQAIRWACAQAWPHPKYGAVHWTALTPARRKEMYAWRREHDWTPHDIRRACATRLRAVLGLDAARAVLGHSSVRTTELYAERDLASAMQAMQQHG